MIGLIADRHGAARPADISGGLYNGIIFGGVNDTGRYSVYEFNRVHQNGHETDDGICDYVRAHTLLTDTTTKLMHVPAPASPLPRPLPAASIYFDDPPP